MRESLKTVIENAIILECHLPCGVSGLGRSCLSTQDDKCYRNDDSVTLSRIIYNGIVEYAVNQYKINYDELEAEQMRTIARRIRYNAAVSQTEKLRYGFYGEILLDLILRCYIKTNVLLARGYFYSPLENSEPKGFDAFHILEHNGKLNLWFGEAKFYIDYKQAIKSVVDKIHISLSDSYVGRNIVALIENRDKFTTSNSKLNDLLSAWEDNPNINIVGEMNARNMSLTYPVFIAYEQTDMTNYHNNIKGCIDYIKELVDKAAIEIPATFDYRISFVFLPVNEVTKVKERVIEWIEAKEPLMP